MTVFKRLSAHEDFWGYLSIVSILVSTSFSAILIRNAQNAGMESPAIASLRLIIASLVLTPYVLRHYGATLYNLRRRELMMTGLAGLWLGAHFILFITGLEHTSVMIAAVAVSTSPLWVSIMERIFLRVRLHHFVWIGIFVAMLGGVIIAVAGNAVETGENPVLGAFLALCGAISLGVYLILGRQVQVKLSAVPYIWMVYSFGGVTAFAYVILTATPLTGYSSEAYFWIIMVALIAQLIGHGSINFALRYFSASYVSIVGQTAAIGATILAFLLFDEVPTILQGVGASGILCGVILATIGKGRSTKHHGTPIPANH